MKTDRNAMAFMARIVYFAVLGIILWQIYEPLKTFMESESRRLWIGAVLYAFTLFLSIFMPIFCAIEAVRDARDNRKDGFWFMTVLFIFFAFLAYPLVAHAVTTISQSGWNLVQFKESILDFKNPELGWYGLWYVVALFVYGGTAVFGVAISATFIIVMCVSWGWNQVIKLVVDFSSGKNDH